MFDLQQLFLVWGIIVLASLIRSFTGFGFALAAVPVFAFIMPPSQAVVLSASLSLGIGLSSLPSYRHDVPVGALLPLLLTALPGTVVGALLLTRLSPADFMLWIGLAVILASIVLSFYRPSRQRPRPLLGLATGLGSGLMNGAFAIPGPPVVVYALATETVPARARALMISFFTISALIALLSYGWADMLGMDSLWQFLPAFPAMLVGDRLGLVLFQRYGNALYRRAAVGVLLAVGLVTLAEAFG